MELSKTIIPAFAGKNIYNGTGNFDLSDGKLEIKVGGDKALEEEVPEGKKWAIHLVVEIHESDE